LPAAARLNHQGYGSLLLLSVAAYLRARVTQRGGPQRRLRLFFCCTPEGRIDQCRHHTLLAVTGGSASGLSATDAWVEPLSAVKKVYARCVRGANHFECVSYRPHKRKYTEICRAYRQSWSTVMPKYTCKPIAEGLDTASTQFRELAAECVELAQKSHSPERRMEYVKMANAWHKKGNPLEKRLP
jgi:hypothetical protein